MMLPRDMTDQLGFREGETVSRYSVGRSHVYFATTDNRLLIWSIGY
jgi:hypothetical protein